MAGSIFGKIFRIATWGESHGKGLGVVVDGCPAGIPLTEADIQADMDRRKPGSNQFGTKRNESDAIEILSGVFEGKTTGAPISLILYNQDNRSRDYGDIAHYYRPGHADYTFDIKYGIRDYRGGGRSSGRETAARVAAGAIAKKILSELNIHVRAYTVSVGEIRINRAHFDEAEIRNNPLSMPDKMAYEKAARYITEVRVAGDSVGGVIECVVNGMIAGLGDPVFDKLEAELAKAVLSIGAAKGIEFGQGFNAARLKGSEHNDAFTADNGGICKQTNHAGGTLGGISDGSDIVFRVPFKPTPSIAQTQQTVTQSREPVAVNIPGRHDPIIVPRAVVVVEAMTALTVADLLLVNMTSKMAYIKKIYLK